MIYDEHTVVYNCVSKFAQHSQEERLNGIRNSSATVLKEFRKHFTQSQAEEILKSLFCQVINDSMFITEEYTDAYNAIFENLSGKINYYDLMTMAKEKTFEYDGRKLFENAISGITEERPVLAFALFIVFISCWGFDYNDKKKAYVKKLTDAIENKYNEFNKKG